MDEIQIQTLIYDLALILTLGAAATIIFKLLKQPVVLGYIVAGFIPNGFISHPIAIVLMIGTLFVIKLTAKKA